MASGALVQSNSSRQKRAKRFTSSPSLLRYLSILMPIILDLLSFSQQMPTG